MHPQAPQAPVGMDWLQFAAIALTIFFTTGLPAIVAAYLSLRNSWKLQTTEAKLDQNTKVTVEGNAKLGHVMNGVTEKRIEEAKKDSVDSTVILQKIDGLDSKVNGLDLKVTALTEAVENSNKRIDENTEAVTQIRVAEARHNERDAMHIEILQREVQDIKGKVAAKPPTAGS